MDDTLEAGREKSHHGEKSVRAEMADREDQKRMYAAVMAGGRGERLWPLSMPEKPRLLKLTKELRLKNVEFREPVPKALQEVDAFIFNLGKAEVFRYEINPNKLFDYMAAGKAVIFSVDAPNNPVEEARCGLPIPPRDP